MNPVKFKYQIYTRVFLIIFLLVEPGKSLFAQYINPAYGGVTANAGGTVGSLGIGESYGYLNPAGTFSYYPILSTGISTGFYSDWILYLPTMKHFALRYPIILNRINISLIYGTPDDNKLRYNPGRNILHNGETLNTYYRNEFAGVVAVHPMLREYVDKLDIYFGLRLSKYWASYSSGTTINNYGAGITLRTGCIIDYYMNEKYKLQFSGIIQPNSIPEANNPSYLGFIGGGLGIGRILDIEKGNRFELVGEMLMPIETRSKALKLSAGFSYYLNTIQNRSFSIGIYSFPANPYTTYNPVYWSTYGFTWEFDYLTVSAAVMDAANLDMIEHSGSDVGKIFTFSLDIPFKIKKLQSITAGNRSYPIIYNPSYFVKKLKSGTSDTLTYCVTNYGPDIFRNAVLYSNIVGKDGIIVRNKVVQLGDIASKGTKKVEINMESIKGYQAGEYILKSECYYRPDAAVTKLTKIKTVEPALKISFKVKEYRQFLVSYIPGVIRLKVGIKNTGNLTADDIKVILDSNLVKMNMISKSVYLIRQLLPGQQKDFDLTLVLPDTISGRTIPFTVTVKEKNGYDPLPYYATINLVNRGKYYIEEWQRDAFRNKFFAYQNFFIVIDTDYEGFSKIYASDFYDCQRNPLFPGKLCIGPYLSLQDVYNNYISLKNQYKNACVYGVNGNQYDILSRYFIAVNKTDQIIDKLIDLEIGELYQSLQEQHVILIGPFKDLMQIQPMYEFFKVNFLGARVVNYLPNDVKKYIDGQEVQQ